MNLTVAEVTIQLVEFTPIRDRVERTQTECGPLHGNGFDAVRVHDTSLGPNEVETPLELLAAGERKHRIQTVGRELSELLDGCHTPRVDHVISAELSDQTGRRSAGCGRDDVRPSLNGELNRQRADGARRTEDQNGLSSPQLEVVDPLERGQPGGGNRSGIAKVKSFRHTPHVLSVRGGELGVEAALAIAELVGVDTVAELNTPNARAFGDDNSRPVNSRHQGEVCSSGSSPGTVANRGIPAADAGRIDRDEHLVRSWPRHWNLVQSQRRWRTESIQCGGFHGVGNDRQ